MLSTDKQTAELAKKVAETLSNIRQLDLATDLRNMDPKLREALFIACRQDLPRDHMDVDTNLPPATPRPE
jgi:hypothetical protein